MDNREQLKSNLRNERHRNLEETHYWCDQYKMLAIKMEAEIAEVRVELALALKVPSIAAMHTWLDSECAKKSKQLETELAALNITSQQLRERVAELETDLKLTSEMLVGVSRKGMALQEELATLKSAPVVMPDRHKLEPYYQTVNTGSKNWLAGWNACLDEFERLNRSKNNEHSAPAGWKWVPVEPTEEMVKGPRPEGYTFSVYNLYKAMLAAAPAQPQNEAKAAVPFAYHKKYMGGTDFMLHEPWCEDGISPEWEPLYAAAQAQPQGDAVIVPRAIAERMAIDAAQYEHEHAVVHDNVQLWQQPGARLTLTVGDLRTVRALLGGDHE